MSEAAVRRFEREAQVIARLRLLRRFGPVPPERTIYLLRQVCHSLSWGGRFRGEADRDLRRAREVTSVPESRLPEFDPAIAEFYHRTPEEDRLENGPFVLESEPSRLGASAHLLVVARRPA